MGIAAPCRGGWTNKTCSTASPDPPLPVARVSVAVLSCTVAMAGFQVRSAASAASSFCHPGLRGGTASARAVMQPP
eukprot:6930234-Prorocentrum_lima.AAC.1